MHLIKTAVVLSALLSPALAVWPRPASFIQGNRTVQVDLATFRIVAPDNAPADLIQAVKRTESAIRKDRLSPLVVGRGEDRRAVVQAAPVVNGVRVKLEPSSKEVSTLKAEVLQPVEDWDESYELNLPADGSAGTLSASSLVGVLRGLATLEQLVYALPNEGATNASASAHHTRYIDGVPIRIKDKPAYPWRGLHLDTSRNYFSVASIERTLDAMAFVKLNSFHWHIVDAQSFPLQLPGKLGVLADKGAYSAAEVYTPADVAHLVDYAAQRGININVEIDMPGHMYEGIVDYDPRIVVCPNKRDWSHWSNEPPSGQLALNDSAATTFATELIAATAALFPSPYFSTGGDEVEFSCYNATSAAEIDASLLKPFIERVHGAVERAGKRPLVWEEMAITFPETGKSLRNGTVVEAWTTSTNVGAILRATPAGVKLIHAPADYFYLDCGAGGWLGNRPEGQSWCPFVTWQKSYTFDPLLGTEDVPGGKERVLGGEVALWAEQADEVSMDGYLWPRAGSAAEVFWTGAAYLEGGHPTNRTLSDALPRLHELRYRLVDRGYGARPLQPHWCALRPGQCDLV